MSEKEKLIRELNNLSMDNTHVSWQAFCADFILADRRRVVEPLVKWKDEMNIIDRWPDAGNAIFETLRLAGLEPK